LGYGTTLEPYSATGFAAMGTVAAFDLAAKYGSSFNIILEFQYLITSFHVLRERLDTSNVWRPKVFS